jgi:DNA-binding HxlR family transcriptional regulator
MEVFEEKGFIKILHFLSENPDKTYSKYEIQKATKLSSNTLKKRIISLKKYYLIEETPEVGPRARTEIKLSNIGKEIAQLLIKIMKKIGLLEE